MACTIEGVMDCRRILLQASFFAFFLSLTPGICVAEVSLGLEKNAIYQIDPESSFIVPNERYPHHALNIFEMAPKGAYVTVGTERGFISAANSPNVTELVLVDNSESIIKYNEINILLLKIAKTREHYLQLRTNPKLWKSAAREYGLSKKEARDLRKSKKDWSSLFLSSKNAELLERYQQPP